MTALPVEAITSVAGAATPALTSGANPVSTAAPGFPAWVEKELAGLNTQLLTAEQGLRSLAAGHVENLHDVMLQLEQARLAMQVAGQVRARVLEVYQDVLRMQV